MRIGLIDVDGHNFPNIPLMKISAWHKAQGDSVEWYYPLLGHFDKVYVSKVFSDTYSPEYNFPIYADEIIKGGSGYCITTDAAGKERYDKSKDTDLPQEIEHIYPDYTIYPEYTHTDKKLNKQVAYGFLSRGCPRGCSFCHVKDKEGLRSYKVADLQEFWHGQGNIVLCDPNLLACPEWRDLLGQLKESQAWIDINQGFDIRLMTEEKAELITSLKLKEIHFAWDKIEDKELIVPKFQMFREMSRLNYRKMIVYVLVNYDTTIEQDLDRIYTLRDLGYNPYIQIYNREQLPKRHELRRLQRWVNNRYVFDKVKRFEEYR